MNPVDNAFEVAVVQFASTPGAREQNVDRALSVVSDVIASGHSLRLICLPEGFDVGYDLDLIKCAELPSPPPSLTKMKDFAQRHQLCIVYGSIERVGERVLNIALVVLPNGRVSRYEKTHLFSTDPLLESEVFALGNGRRVIVPWSGVNVGVQICYDVRFPEMSRSLCLEGADLICMPAAWPAVRRDIWRTLVIARAMENQVYVLAANQVPSPGGLEFAGTSLIVGPDGRVIGEGSEREETVLLATVDIAAQRQQRESIPLWRHRRPEVYRWDT
jgi:omega-amidase